MRHKIFLEFQAGYSFLNRFSSERRCKKGAIVIVFGRLCSLIQNAGRMVQGIESVLLSIAAIDMAQPTPAIAPTPLAIQRLGDHGGVKPR